MHLTRPMILIPQNIFMALLGVRNRIGRLPSMQIQVIENNKVLTSLGSMLASMKSSSTVSFILDSLKHKYKPTKNRTVRVVNNDPNQIFRYLLFSIRDFHCSDFFKKLQFSYVVKVTLNMEGTMSYIVV